MYSQLFYFYAFSLFPFHLISITRKQPLLLKIVNLMDFLFPRRIKKTLSPYTQITSLSA